MDAAQGVALGQLHLASVRGALGVFTAVAVGTRGLVERVVGTISVLDGDRLTERVLTGPFVGLTVASVDIGSIHIPPGGSTRPSSGFFPFARGRGGGREPVPSPLWVGRVSAEAPMTRWWHLVRVKARELSQVV